MKIIFKELQFKNVFSYGNKITKMTFKNGIDIISGKNGKGKSTFADALTYGLFGKSFRKIKLHTLINDKNNKQLWVQIIFDINDKTFKIIRGMKPDIFEIFYYQNDEWKLIEKPSTNKDYQRYLEKNILQFNENVFRQLIVLGANLSSSKNFMDLTSREKEEVLQVITDTSVFTKISEKIKEKRYNYKTLETEYKYKVEILNSSLSSTKINISAMEQQNAEFNFNKDKIINELNEEIQKYQDKLLQYPKAYEALDKLEQEKNEHQKEINILKSKLNKIIDKENQLKSDYQLFISNEKNKIICPNCSFEIKDRLTFDSESLKKSLTNVLSEKNKTEQHYNNLLEMQQERINKLNNRSRLNHNENTTKESFHKAQERLEKTKAWEEIHINYDELKIIEKEFNEAKNKLIEIKQKLSELNELEDMVSDNNLKGIILNQQLPFLNKHINEFLELFQSKFNFVIDNNFNENIISRESNNEFNSLSNGQKQRISLSILFAFLKLIEEKNGVSTNLLILDEYLDSSLDVEGIDEVMQILSTIFSVKKDVILISHNPDIKNRIELLNRSISVDMKNGFSQIEMQKL